MIRNKWTRSLAVVWAADRVRVNAIAPGLFPHDDMPAALVAARDPELDAARQPIGRVGEPRELGWAATYRSIVKRPEMLSLSVARKSIFASA